MVSKPVVRHPGQPLPSTASRTTDYRSRLTAHGSLFYLLSLFCFALGLMSKPMLVTWPLRDVAAGLLAAGENAECGMQNAESEVRADTHHAPRSTLLRLVWEKIPFFALAAAASVVTFVVQQHGGAVADVESLPLGARSGNALISYGRYLGKLFWPTDLAVYYPHPGQWPLGKVLLAGGVILGLSVLVWVPRRRASLFADGVAVVFGDAGPGDWAGASGRSGDGGSVYLSSRR